MTAAVQTELRWRQAPGWDRVESGLDLSFKALSVRVWLLIMQGFLLVVPAAESTPGLAGIIQDSLLGPIALTSAYLVMGVARCGQAPQGSGARPLIKAALVAMVALLVLDVVRLVHVLTDLLGTTRLAEAVVFVDHLTLLAGLALLLAAVARLAHFGRDRGALRWAIVGQAAVAVYVALFATLFLSGLLEVAPWPMLAGLVAVVLSVFALFPLHAVARRIKRAGAPAPPRDDTLDELPARWPPRRVVSPEPTDEADGDDDDDVDWRPRRQRQPAREIPDRPSWKTARDGLRLYLNALAARVAIALFAMLAVGGGFTGWPGAFLILALAVALTGCSGAAAIGLFGYQRVPAISGGRGLARGAFAAALLAVLLDLVALGLLVASLAGDRPWRGAWQDLTTVGYVLAVALLISLLLSLRRLGLYLRRSELYGRSGLLLWLLVFVGAAIVGLGYLGRSPESDVANLAIYLGALIIALVLFTLAMYLRLLHEGAEAIEDHLVRQDLGD